MDISVGIIDYGAGNVASLFNAVSNLGYGVKVTSDEKTLFSCSHIILPGVGSFGAVSRKLQSRVGFDLTKRLAADRPFLGICVGMQLLGTASDEFATTECGLNLLPGQVSRIDDAPLLPHVGWNNLTFTPESSSILRGIKPNDDFYFVHSFAFSGLNSRFVIAHAEYGSSFPAVVQNENVFGVQFHPEKSGRTGQRILQNFLAL
jgi:glutamine amidotransferase